MATHEKSQWEIVETVDNQLSAEKMYLSDPKM